MFVWLHIELCISNQANKYDSFGINMHHTYAILGHTVVSSSGVVFSCFYVKYYLFHFRV